MPGYSFLSARTGASEDELQAPGPQLLASFLCNRCIAKTVFPCSVDAIWTWMILTLMRWSKPRLGMTMKRLANWCADSIRLSRKWCGPIGRDELLRRIFAK